MAQVLAAFGQHGAAPATVRWAAEFCGRSGADLVVVHAVETVARELDSDLWSQVEARRQTEIEAALGHVTDAAFTVEVIEGEPHAALVERAGADGVEMVVTGKHTAGGAGGFGGSGTAHHLIHHGSTPVAVVEGDGALGDGPIVVGVDGSDANARALERADAIASELSTEVVCVFCTDPMADTFAHPEGWQYPHEHEVRDELASTVGARRLLIEAGHPTETLARVAGEQQAALLVVGTRGRGGFGRLRAGRVPVQLLDHSPCPLLVVPH